jgi:hypothetical protein
MEVEKLKELNKEIVNSALCFLETLSDNLEKLNHLKISKFELEPEKVSYFDLKTSQYKLYDYKEFNTVMADTYFSNVVESKIYSSQIYWQLKLCMDIVHTNSKFGFYKNIFTTYHLLSWFFKSLRLSEKNNQFDLNVVINNFPFPFLESDANLDDNINFLVKFFNLIKEKNVVDLVDLNMNFKLKNQKDILSLINFSFEPLVFGGNMNLYSVKICSQKINLDLLSNPKISDDYKFNYIISMSTNYITYDNCSNNIFLH